MTNDSSLGIICYIKQARLKVLILRRHSDRQCWFMRQIQFLYKPKFCLGHTKNSGGGGALYLAKKSTQGRAGKYLFPLELMVNGPSISGFHVRGVTGHSSGFPS